MRASAIFAFAILVTAVTVMTISLGYPSDARNFPLAISIVVTVFTVILIIKELFVKDEQKLVSAEKKIAGKQGGHELPLALVWIASLLVMIYLLGFLMGAPLFILLYLKLHHETWLLSLGMSATMAVIIYGVFILALEVPLYKGVLFVALN